MEANSETLLFNRNDKQLHFNKVKGTVYESNDGDNWCSFTLSLGHENTRFVNLAIKKHQYDTLKDKYPVGTKVSVIYYLTSRFKNGRWYTTANILQMELAT